MNVRPAIIAWVVVAGFGGLFGAACNGKLDAMGAGASYPTDGGATDATVASSGGLGSTKLLKELPLRDGARCWRPRCFGVSHRPG
jgi:hypothetical protein